MKEMAAAHECGCAGVWLGLTKHDSQVEMVGLSVGGVAALLAVGWWMKGML
jgi:hypothetical protein